MIILVSKFAFILNKYHLDGLILKWITYKLCFVNFILEQKSLFEDMREGVGVGRLNSYNLYRRHVDDQKKTFSHA